MSKTYLVRAHALPSEQSEARLTKPICGVESWRTFLPGIEAGYAPWLRTDGSLTLRIQQRCENFSVCNVHNRLAAAVYDEAALLGLPAQKKIYTREVFLHADGKPVVFAHSVVAAQHLFGAWHALRNLGNRPLGALLFAHPLVRRSALHLHVLKPNHPLYRRATVAFDTPPQKLWARRSLFVLRNAPLLVTEIFLPDILALKK
jgi:chorismate--pyruvate lyase